jgi:hypothetical protein
MKTLSIELNEVAATLMGLSPKEVRIRATSTGYRLEKRWYDSQCTDFGIYADPEYPIMMLDCYRGWTRTAAVNAIKFCQDTNFTPSSILDVYAGSGQSTVLFALAFPQSTVWFHNVEPTQVEFMERLADQYAVTNIKVTKDPVPSELVFAAEAMEHVKDPLAFLTPVLTPIVKTYIDVSSFTIDSPGHFPVYQDGGRAIPREEMKGHFFNRLRGLGYYGAHLKAHFKYPRFFNGHPNVLIRKV